MTYDAFGNITNETSPTFGDQFKWTGARQDPETGFLLNDARYYSPALGRWTSEDPIGFGGGDPNLYRYAGNDSRKHG